MPAWEVVTAARRAPACDVEVEHGLTRWWGASASWASCSMPSPAPSPARDR